MLVKTLASIGWLLGVVLLTDPAVAEEGARVVSSEVTSRYVDLGLGKVVAVELPKDVNNVVVGDSKKVTVVMRTAKRAYVIGAARGHTSVYFFDDAEQQIAALDINVSALSRPLPPPLEGSALPLDSPVVIYHDTEPSFYWCSSARCYAPYETEKEAKTNPNEIIIKLDKSP